MTTYHLAVDIGASSGRLVLGWAEAGAIRLREVHRFANAARMRNGLLCWDTEHFIREIVAGMRQCAAMGTVPASVAIDTWGVDFVLVDETGAPVGEAVSYRDDRTIGAEQDVFAVMDEAELYRRTGIQRQPFNTIYQLSALTRQNPEQLAKAARMLLMPEYLNFILTGNMVGEYTNATTTQLVDAHSGEWDWDIIDALRLPRRLFMPLAQPGAVVGRLRSSIREAVGFDTEVVLPASHDTASAVLAVPFGSEPSIFLSSGTWSLIGVERAAPDCGEDSRQRNFTNEGGYGGRFRFLKNIMGLWIIQSIRRELGEEYDFATIMAMAASSDFDARIDVHDRLFLAPDSMTDALRRHCRDTGQTEPADARETLACAYRSLARSYAEAADEIDAVTGVRHPVVNIVGGGSRDTHLNQLTALYTGRKVCAGPVEATAIGNIIAQMLRVNTFASVDEARRAVAESFPVEEVAI